MSFSAVASRSPIDHQNSFFRTLSDRILKDSVILILDKTTSSLLMMKQSDDVENFPNADLNPSFWIVMPSGKIWPRGIPRRAIAERLFFFFSQVSYMFTSKRNPRKTLCDEQKFRYELAILVCWDRTERCLCVCLSVCLSVCLCLCVFVIFTAQTDGSILMKLSTNDLNDICQWHISKILKFQNRWRHISHFVLFE